jgi:hypothetical membrane protein
MRVLSVGGIIGPVSYTIVVIVLGLLWPGYIHLAQAISELGGVGAPNATIMNTAGFALTGILIIVFALGLYYGLDRGHGSKVGSALVAVYGLGMFGIAFFPWDKVNLASFTSTMHSLIGWPHWIGLTLGLLVLPHNFKKDLQWNNYWVYTLSTGLLTAVVIVVYAFIGIEGYMSVLQRIIVGIVYTGFQLFALVGTLTASSVYVYAVLLETAKVVVPAVIAWYSWKSKRQA